MKRTPAAAFLIFTVLSFGLQMPATSQTVSTRFMAFCADGDGALSDWVNTRNEAYLAGREHEVTAKQHRWEILTQQGETATREPSCALVADGEKPDTIKVGNKCGRCVKFYLSRTSEDGSVKSREFTIDSKKSKHFRKTPGSKITVDAERDCPE
ncbi:MAG: hypothetical protein ABL984_03350 [Pyrinomonadaceae bacterium]